jgi:hypothetical protein
MAPVTLEEGRDELTAEEMAEFAAEQVRTYLGMTVAEFRQHAQDGTLPMDNWMVVHLALLTGVDLPSC